MEERTLHRVSIKVAIYSPDGKSVLTTNIPSLKGHGLPGGHLDVGEEPLDTLKRELMEELGINDAYDFKLKDSWWHEDGKLVLGYTGKRDSLELPLALIPEDEFGEWVEVENISEEIIGSYAQFIKKFRPKLKTTP